MVAAGMEAAKRTGRDPKCLNAVASLDVAGLLPTPHNHQRDARRRRACSAIEAAAAPA